MLRFPSALLFYQSSEPERRRHSFTLDPSARGLSPQLHHRLSLSASLSPMADGEARSLHPGHPGVSGARCASGPAGAAFCSTLLHLPPCAVLLFSWRTLSPATRRRISHHLL